MLYLIKVYLFSAKKLSNLDSNMPEKFDSTFSSGNRFHSLVFRGKKELKKIFFVALTCLYLQPILNSEWNCR